MKLIKALSAAAVLIAPTTMASPTPNSISSSSFLLLPASFKGIQPAVSLNQKRQGCNPEFDAGACGACHYFRAGLYSNGTWKEPWARCDDTCWCKCSGPCDNADPCPDS